MMLPQSKRFSLLLQPSFAFYLLSCLIVNFGSGMSYIAMVWVVVSLDPSVNAVMIGMVMFWLPNILLSPLAGVIADRFERKWVVAINNFARATLVLVFTLIYWDHFTLLSIYLIGLIQGISFTVYFPSGMALVRELVAKEDLVYANSMIDIAFEIGNMVGMSTAGFFLALFSVGTTFLIYTTMFILSGLLIAVIRKKHLRYKETVIREKQPYYRDFVDGFNYVVKRKELLVVYTLQLLMMVQFSTIPVLLGPFVKDVLHASVRDFGHIEAALSCGLIISGLLGPWVVNKVGFVRASLFFFFLITVGLAGFYEGQSVEFVITLYFIMGFGLAAWAITMTMAQHMTELNFQGRVQSMFSSLSALAILICFALVGVVSHYMSIRWLYLCEMIFSVAGLCLLVIYRRELPTFLTQG